MKFDKYFSFIFGNDAYEIAMIHRDILRHGIKTCYHLRYYVFCNPIRARYLRTTRSAVLTVLSMWLVAIVITLPLLWIQRLEQRLELTPGEQPSIKIAHLCVEYFSKYEYDVAYTYGFFIVFFLGPVCVMIYAYGMIGRILWHRKFIGEPVVAGQRRVKQENQRRTIVRMFFVIVLCFVVCWLPFFALHIVLVHVHTLTYDLRVVMAFIKAVGYSNSFINPFIYFCLNAKFNYTVRKLAPCRSWYRFTRSAIYSRKRTTQVTSF